MFCWQHVGMKAVKRDSLSRRSVFSQQMECIMEFTVGTPSYAMASYCVAGWES